MTSEELLASDRAEIARRMLLVIKTEGPILDDVLEKRVLHSYGLKKRGNRIAPFFREIRLSLNAVTTTQISSDGQEHLVYWQESWRGKDIARLYDSFRAPSARDITEYPLIEVANLMQALGPKKSRKTLWVDLLHAMGFSKQGTQIRATFKLAAAWLKANR